MQHFCNLKSPVGTYSEALRYKELGAIFNFEEGHYTCRSGEGVANGRWS